MNNFAKNLWKIFTSKTDSCNLFPIYSRVAVYGLLITGILYINAEHFDITEIMVVISFISIITVIEMVWKKLKIGENLLWHFGALFLLVCFLGLLLKQSTEYREAWYRTHTLETNIHSLITDAKIPIISADANGNIKIVNPAASRLIGWTDSELRGKHLRILMRESKYKSHEIAFEQVVKKLRGTRTPIWIPIKNQVFRILHKDGHLIRVQIETVGVPFMPKEEGGVYPAGEDIEIYAFINPIKMYVDPEEMTPVINKQEK